jgi:hypothetical protein
VAGATPTAGLGVVEPPPMAKGVVRPPPKAPKKKKKNEKWILVFWGWPDHPQGPGGGFGHPKPAFWGGRIHPQVLGGGPATPKRPKSIFRFFFFFGAFGGGRTTPLAMGVVRPPPV